MILIKAGGGKEINWEYIAEDIADITKTEQIVVVHGASVVRDDIANRMGVPTKTITSPSGISSVYTDSAAIEVFLMSYAGLANKKIVAAFQRHGIPAVGLSGVDGALWRAKKKNHVYSVENGKTKLITANLTGRVAEVNSHLLKTLIEAAYVPVLCPPALSYENEIINTDNDWASAIVAGALGVKKIVVLFEAGGLLKDFNDPTSVIPRISKEGLETSMEFAKGRMKKKILGAKKAFELGVETIYWSDGRVKNPVKHALEGKGTVINS